MRFVNTVELFDKAQEAHKKGDFDTADKMYNALLSKSLDNPNVLFLLGTVNMQKGNNGLAILLLNRCIERMPKDKDSEEALGAAWNHLAICLKKEDHVKSADFAYEQAEKYLKQPGIPANRASIYINNGTPEKCIEHANRSLGIDPNFIMAKWHKALGLLELQKWDEAWEWHEARLHPDSACDVGNRKYGDEETPLWDGGSKGLVAVHGEQGLGDEIMFASCIPDAIKSGANLVIEPNPRLHGLFKRSFPECEVYGTHKSDGSEWKNGRKVDYKIALGSLPKFYRRKESDFPGKPYLIADPERAAFYRKRLDDIGTRPKIGIAWQGGVMKTGVSLRSIYLPDLEPILSQDADFISLAYHSTAEMDIAELEKKTGLVVHHWKEAASGEDMDDQAALISQLDLVITVCQTAVHVSGGLGIPCWVLTPSKPSWRYGVVGNMPWYESVDLYRQKKDEDWKPVINRAKEELCLFLRNTGNKTENFTNPIRLTA